MFVLAVQELAEDFVHQDVLQPVLVDVPELAQELVVLLVLEVV